MRNHEWRTALQAAMYLSKGPAAFIIRQKVERQKACASIVWSFWRLMNVALLQIYSGSERTQGTHSQLQHLGGGVDSDEFPPRMSHRKRPQFQASSGAQNQNSGFLGRVFFKKKGRHALQICKTWHLARRIVSISRYGLST